MKFDIVLAGVGGQGVLSMAALIGSAAVAEGLHAKQSEVHGMAQRGGSVQAQLRIADRPVESDLIPRGTADLILSLEPVEALRMLDALSPAGAVVTAAATFANIPDLPEPESIRRRIEALPRGLAVDADRLAEEAGDAQTVNTVLVGAASAFLPLRTESLQEAVRRTFARKGEAVVATNLAAFAAGRRAAP